MPPSLKLIFKFDLIVADIHFTYNHVYGVYLFILILT